MNVIAGNSYFPMDVRPKVNVIAGGGVKQIHNSFGMLDDRK